MNPHILLLTSSSRNFPLEMQDVLKAAKLESTRLATLADFIASPLRREPFLAVLEIGNLEDIDRALLAFEWAESMQPLAPARFLLLIGSKHLSLGDKAARFRGAEVAQLPLPARNILFKMDLQLKLLSNPAAKPPEGRGFVPLVEGTAEKERVLVFKGPGPKEGSWQAGENSPQGKVRWRWVDNKPKPAAEAALKWVVESRSPPKFEEATKVWSVKEPEADLKCLNEKEEIFSALASETTLKKQEALPEVAQVSPRERVAREKISIDLGESVGEREEEASHFTPDSPAPADERSARADEIVGVGSLGAAKLPDEKTGFDFFNRPDSPKEKTKEIFRDPAELPPVNHGKETSSPALEGLSIKRKNDQNPKAGEGIDRPRPQETLVHGKKEPTRSSLVDAALSSRTEKIQSESASPGGHGSRAVTAIESVSSLAGGVEHREPGARHEAARPEAVARPEAKQNEVAAKDVPERLPADIAPRPARAGSAPSPEIAREHAPFGVKEVSPREEIPGRAPKREASETEIESNPSEISSLPGLAVTLRELSGATAPASATPFSHATTSQGEAPIRNVPGSSSIAGSQPSSEGERIVLGSGGHLPNSQIVSPASGRGELEARRLVREASAPSDKSPDHYLKMRHFLTMTLEELQDKNSSWYPVDGYRIYLSAHHRYYGFSKPEELFPLWVYEGELAPEFLDAQKAWKFYDRLPTPHTGLAGLPDSIMRYFSVTIGARQAEEGRGPRAKSAAGGAGTPGEEKSTADAMLLLHAKKPSGKRPWREKFQRFIRKAFGMKVD